jgi:hypothetical protein
MTRTEEKAWINMRRHRDALAKLASETRTGFFTEEDREPSMRLAERLQGAANGIDLEMLRLESGDPSLTELDRARKRFLEAK